MQRKKPNIFFFILAIVFLVALLFFAFSVSPNTNLAVLNISVSTTPVFFVLLFGFFVFLLGFLLGSLKQGVIIGLFLIGLLVLRMLHVTQILFYILLFAAFVCTEVVLRK